MTQFEADFERVLQQHRTGRQQHRTGRPDDSETSTAGVDAATAEEQGEPPGDVRALEGRIRELEASLYRWQCIASSERRRADAADAASRAAWRAFWR